jgi:predicted permease
VITIAGALVPIFLLIVLGWVLRRTQFLPDGFWMPAEKLTYYILFPALLLGNLAEARLDGLPVAELASAHGLAVLAMAGLAVAVRPALGRAPFRLDGPGFTSLFQCVIRPNTYVGLAAAAGLFGAQGLTLTAICVATVVPLVNLLSVVAMVRFAAPPGTSPRWTTAAMAVAKNPLIAACLVGIALNFTGLGLPPFTASFFHVLGQGALSMGLLAVGAGLELKALKDGGAAVLLSAVLKLVLLPLVVGCLAGIMGVRGVPLAVCVAYAGLPCAPNAYVLARQMGGDAALAAGIISVQTVVAVITLPMVIVALTG